MQKKVLTEQSLFYGDIDMPKGFEIDQEKLTNDILQSTFNSKELLIQMLGAKQLEYFLQNRRFFQKENKQ